MSETANAQPTIQAEPEALGWKIMRRTSISVAVIITIIAAFHLVEGIRGKRAWDKFKAEMAAAGESLDPKQLLPPPVPDDQNFAMTPLLAPLLDYEYTDGPGKYGIDWPKTKWRQQEAKERLEKFYGVGKLDGISLTDRYRRRLTDLAAWQSKFRNDTNFSGISGFSKALVETGSTNSPAETTARYDPQYAAEDVLLALSKYDAEMNELHAAAKRPHAQFPIHIEEGFACLLPHLQVLRNFGRVVHLKAAALLAENRPDEALAEVLLLIRFVESLRDEPVLISGLVDIAMSSMVSDLVWEGMVRKQWTPQHLATLERRLRDRDYIESYRRAIRGERALGVVSLFRFRDRLEVLTQDEAVSTILRWAPAGVFHQNLVYMGRMYDDYVLQPVDFEGKTIDFAAAEIGEAEMQEVFSSFHPYRICASLMFPAFNRALQRYGEAQAEVDQLRLACAIELFRARNNKLPSDLSELVPDQLPELPHDPVNGNGYIYIPEGDDYLIYSIGSDRTDNGGTVIWKEKKPNERARDQGDWVWHSSLKKSRRHH